MILPEPLHRLAERVGAATALPEPPFAAAIRAALAESVARTDWLPEERRRANHERYARHVIHADPLGRFCILALVWSPGQMSPVHGHCTWCAVAVYQGELAETTYRERGAGEMPEPIASVRRVAGSVSFDPALSAIHRIANASDAVAISLHVYGVDQAHVSTGINRVYA